MKPDGFIDRKPVYILLPSNVNSKIFAYEKQRMVLIDLVIIQE